jgi:MSHA biogenesis protein MshL
LRFYLHHPLYIAPTAARSATVLICLLLQVGCGIMPVARIDNHIRPQPSQPSQTQSTTPAASAIPQPVRQVPIPPPPKAAIEEKRYSVTVIDVPAREILLAMSRDTGINIDIHSGIEGRVTLNAIDQTIKQILTRISRQIDMRWELDGPNIAVLPDSPYLKLYKVDYVNINRDTTGSFGIQTQVVVGVAGATVAGGGGGGGGQNTSTMKIENTSKNRFWDSLEKNLKDILRETDKQLPEGSSETFVRGQNQGSNTGTTRTQTSANAARTTNSRTGSTAIAGPNESQGQSEQSLQTLTFREAASIIVNTETGTISVRATSRQHEKVGEFIALVSGSAKRQVLIEATIVEVELNDGYQSGVDWSALGLEGLGYSIRQAFTQNSPTVTGASFLNNAFSIGYSNPNAAAGGSISSTVKLLSSFGTTKVLSSPRTMALNNQTAVMKVVENKVFFTITTTPGTTSTSGEVTRPTYSSTPNIVPEGFVLSVTPQIGENDIVTLNIRPSITKVVREVQDPNPGLITDRGVQISNLYPIIQTQEFETVLRVSSGQTTVLGGLMQDSFKTSRDGLPILSRIPVLGDAVSYRNDAGRKSELIVFIRPIVIKDANVETDLNEYRRYLPDSRFFKEAEPIISTANPVVSDPVQPKP